MFGIFGCEKREEPPGPPKTIYSRSKNVAMYADYEHEKRDRWMESFEEKGLADRAELRVMKARNETTGSQMGNFSGSGDRTAHPWHSRGQAVVKRELRTLWWNLREQGIGMARNYAAFRSLFGVHSRPVAWLLNRFHPYPPYVEVEITTACDLRCIQCEHTYWKEPSTMMSYRQLVHILDQFPKLRWIDITGIGEGILHPDFLKMVAEIKRRGIYLELYDAFHRWDRDVSRFMVGAGLNRIQPSIDGCTRETYESIRVRAHWDEVYRNLWDFHREKDRQDKRLPEVSYHFIVQTANQHEMVDYVTMIRELAGLQAVGVQFTELLYEYPEIRGQKYTVPDAQREEVNARAKELSVEVRWNRRMGTEKTDARRCTLWGMPFIFVDGSVIRCCTSNEHNARARQRANALGNIFEEPFPDIWTGARYRTLRKNLRCGVLDEGCRDCPSFGGCS